MLSAVVAWQAVFAVVAGAGAAAGLLAIALLPPDEPARERLTIGSLDLPGAALLAAGLGALLHALKRTHVDGWTGRPVLALGVFGVIALAAFARNEALRASPLLPLALFSRPPFTFGVIGALLLYTVQFMLSYLLPFQLQHAVGLGAAEAGAFMTAQPAAMAAAAPLSGIVADRWGPRVPSTAGMLAIAAGLVVISGAALAPGAALVAALAVVGLGAGLYVTPNTALIMGTVARDRQATAAAMAATARNLGMTLGIAAAAALDHAIGFRPSVLVAAVLAVVGAALGALRPAGATGAGGAAPPGAR
jgi:predicted MFS family arabinose efflux permease